MRCARCDYLLWDLPKNRCPECALPFDVTDYAFAKDSVQFQCPCCQTGYWGVDRNGLPYPSKFECVTCGVDLDVASMPVRPMTETAHGKPIGCGTPWDDRGHAGWVRGFVDGVSRLAIAPAEYFRLSSKTRKGGALLFSVLCAYFAAIFFIATITALREMGLVRWGPKTDVILQPWVIALLIGVIPCLQIFWDYAYGFFIHGILRLLGSRDREVEQSVRAVALSSAVLPALLLMPPIGLPWYLRVVSSGVEHYNETSRGRAILATVVPALVMGNLALCVYAILYA